MIAIPDRVWLALRQTAYVCALALGFGIGFAMCTGCGFAPAQEELGDGSTMPDAGVGGDSGAASDAHDASSLPDSATLTPIVLRETASDAVTPGSSVVCYASGAQSTLDGTWYRVFRLSDFGIASSLVIDRVAFAPDHALNANAIQVKIGTYTGAIGGTTISIGSISIVATASVNVPDSESPQAVVVSIQPPALISAGAVLVVEIAAPSLQGVGHFNLGATTSSETTPGYFGTTACSISPPKSLAALGVSGHVVLDVGGAW